MSTPDPNSLEAHLRLIPSSDLASGRLRLDPGCSGGLMSSGAIENFLVDQTVSRETIDPEGVAELLRLAGETPAETHTVLVCTSRAPEPGRDGGFELVDSIQSRVEEIRAREAKIRQRQLGEHRQAASSWPTTSPPNASPSEHVDFYNQSAFIVVSRGERIGRCVSPTPGQDGLDIFGKVIPTSPGKPSDVFFDRSVTVDDDGNAFAVLPGRLIIDRAGVRVEETLQVDGPVSFATGNIDFPGDVTVSMGVKDHFVIRAGGNVAIRELVEACTIECGGDLHLVVGIAGREMAEFSIGGDFSARYIEACTGSVAGNTEISGEITNCGLNLEGNLLSPTCTVRGGEISVAGRIDISTLGSENGTPTAVHVASLHALDRLIENAMKLGPSLLGALERVVTRLESARSLDAADDDSALMIQSLETQWAEKDATLNKLADHLERTLELTANKTEVHFMVRKVIHPGTVITFKGWRAEFQLSVRGPILLTVNNAGHPMATGPGETTPSPLDRFARVIEDPSTLTVEIAQARVRELRRRETGPAGSQDETSVVENQEIEPEGHSEAA